MEEPDELHRWKGEKVNLLEYMEKMSKLGDISRSELSDIMRSGSCDEKEEAWKKINELGGYDALED